MGRNRAISDRRVVITGIGVTAPGGIGTKAFWDLISEGRTACELTHQHGSYADRSSASPFFHDALYPHLHERAMATSRPPPVFSPVVVAALPGSVRLHFDPARACFVATRNRQFQHAVLQVCIDLRCIEVRAQ